MAELVRKAAVTGEVQRKVAVVTPPIRVRAYPLVSDAVEDGLTYGIRRLFKYDATPLTEDALIAQLETLRYAVMNAISDVLNFGDE